LLSWCPPQSALKGKRVAKAPSLWNVRIGCALPDLYWLISTGRFDFGHRKLAVGYAAAGNYENIPHILLPNESNNHFGSGSFF
jgi:hypothetical protein